MWTDFGGALWTSVVLFVLRKASIAAVCLDSVVAPQITVELDVSLNATTKQNQERQQPQQQERHQQRPQAQEEAPAWVIQTLLATTSHVVLREWSV